jgi:hypothetical protein
MHPSAEVRIPTFIHLFAVELQPLHLHCNDT